MDEKIITELSDVFNALGNPVRLKILLMLRETKRPLHIKALARDLKVNYAAVYRHVEILKNTMLVDIYEVGRSRVLSIRNPALIDELLTLHHRTVASP